VRKLRVDKWRILDEKGESGRMSDLELLGGSCHIPKFPFQNVKHISSTNLNFQNYFI
jgi:hypothetical protein